MNEAEKEAAQARERGNERIEALERGVALAREKLENERAGENRAWVIAAHQHTLNVSCAILAGAQR